ncbi:cysteine rich having a signal peptide [Cryptosporidium sp. chipmunk genotype I]|uniref:cysteine rich having a signal peptide n=1 Tax=Cryptosporidium sp. chipmunk genotype I TaxID=1280935 RepID=UPI00351A2FFA|nr:cysteine rich having a signal peptide [Cryptosporidium sp. chipmunk genotype I]
MHYITSTVLFGLLILCLNSVLVLCNSSLESIPRFQLEDLQLDPENLSENFIRTQNGWSYGGEKLKDEQLSTLPGYMREITGSGSSCPASRSCNVNRSDVDELAERVFILQSEIPELSVDLSWYKVCAFSISIIDTKASFMNHCKSSGISFLLSRPVTKLLEQSIIRLCRNMPQYSTCNGVDLALDSLTEELLRATIPHVLPMAKKSLSFTHFCFVSSRSIRARTREEYLEICEDSVLLLLNLHEMSGSQITPSIAEQICKSTWIYNAECNGFSNTKLISDVAFEMFVLIRKEGIPNFDINHVCQLLTKISSTLRIPSDTKTPISNRKRYLYECTMYLTSMIEHEKLANISESKHGSIEKFCSRGETIKRLNDIATSICTSVSFYQKKNKKKIFIPCLKKKKVVEKKQGESILELFMNLMQSVKATSRRILGWTIELPFPGSDESKAMLMLGYSLNTVDVRSIQNPQYIRMLAILHSKKYILPKTAYNIWKDSVLSIGIEILPPFTPSLTAGIIARPEKDIVDLKLNCGSNNEDVDALALELLSVAHENNLTNLRFYQFCKPSEALVGVRNQDFYSSCIEALKYIPELDIHTQKITGKYLTIPFHKISKLCQDTPRWESTSSGLSYASLIIQDNLKKDELNNTLKPYSKSSILTDRDIYSYVIKTAARSALERSAASDQICKQFKPIYSEEDISSQNNTQLDLDNVQNIANTLFRKAVSLLDEDKQLAFSLSGNTVKGSSPITFESFCSLVLALSKVEKKYFNSECARNLRMMFRQKVVIDGHVRLATIKSRTITKICMSSPQFEKCGNYQNDEIDEISYDLLLGAQKLRFTSITYRHICSVVKNIRRGEIKSLIPKGQTNNTNISSFFNSDCIYGLRTLSIGARHAEIICSGTRFWVMCGNYMDSEVDALASQIYSEVVQNTGLARFITVSLFELVDFCPIAEALLHEVDLRFFNRECVNALAAMSISKEYGKSICQSSRHWQGTCIGTIDDHSSIIEQIDPIAGALYKSSQDLGYLDLLFADFCDSAKELFSIKEVTETGKVLEGHETSMFHIDCPKIVGKMLHSLSEEHSIEVAKFKINTRSIRSISSENFEKAEMICQNFFNYFDPNYGASQVEEYEEANFRRDEIEKLNMRSPEERTSPNRVFLQGKSYNQRMAGNNYYGGHYRYNWANLLAQKFFIPDNRIDREAHEDNFDYNNRAERYKGLQYLPHGTSSKKYIQNTEYRVNEEK